MTENDTNTDEIERGPNGFAYVDTSMSSVGQWENGEFNIKLAREDGELVAANMTPEQFEGLRRMIEDLAERSSS